MSRFENKTLDGYDVMQHVHNIYDILGTTGRESVTSDKSENIQERLNEIQYGNFIQWVGTKSQYEAALASGIIKDTDLCAITDDYVEPPKKK